MFALAEPGRLEAVMDEAGLAEIEVDAIQLDRKYESVDELLQETRDLSVMFADAYEGLDDRQRRELEDRAASLAEQYRQVDGALLLPGRSLVGTAVA
jgi:hypothetical protein